MRQSQTVVLAPAGYLVDETLGSDYERPWRLANGLGKRGLRVVVVARIVRGGELGADVEVVMPRARQPNTPFGRLVDRLRLYIVARAVVRRELRRGGVLAVHHSGPCGEQSPSLVGPLEVPFVYGPVPPPRPASDSGPTDEWLDWLQSGQASSRQRRLSVKGFELARPLARLLWRRTLQRADAVTVESAANAPRGLSTVAVIPPGIDIARFAPRSQQGLAVDGRIIAVGQLVQRKAYDVLFRALARARTTCSSAHLVLVGSGPEEKALRTLATDLGIASAVEFVGVLSRDALVDTLASAVAFCHPARFDSFPLAPLEAMACGLPALVSSAGALPEFVAGGGGIVHQFGDSDELAEQILILLSNRSLAAALGVQARRQVVDCYTWDRMCDAYLALYGRLGIQR
jgi:hypothetical protein